MDEYDKKYKLKRVIIESPYAGNVERNVKYARACMRDSLKRHEAPIASHLLYTQEGVLDDNIPQERALGIVAGLMWRCAAELIVFYTDYGWSPGMKIAFDLTQSEKIPCELRKLKEQDLIEVDSSLKKADITNLIED